MIEYLVIQDEYGNKLVITHPDKNKYIKDEYGNKIEERK